LHFTFERYHDNNIFQIRYHNIKDGDDKI